MFILYFLLYHNQHTFTYYIHLEYSRKEQTELYLLQSEPVLLHLEANMEQDVRKMGTILRWHKCPIGCHKCP